MEYWLENFSKWDPLGQALTIFIVLLITTGFVYSILWIPFKFLTIMVRGYEPVAPVTNNYYNNEEEEEEEDV